MVYMLLGTGFEETEAVAPIDLLRRAGVSVATVGIGGKVIVGSHGIPVTADMELRMGKRPVRRRHLRRTHHSCHAWHHRWQTRHLLPRL